MHIGNIPSEIIRMMLQKSLEDHIGAYPNFRRWGSSLPHLAVCQQWRQLAKPYVYSWADIFAYKTKSAGEYVSNLQLIINVQASLHVKKLIITYNRYNKPHLVFEKVLETMAASTTGWKNVNTLEISITMADILLEEDASVFVKQFAAIVPNINNLYIAGMGSFTTSNILSELANVYLPKLKALDANLSLELTASEFPQTLTKLIIMHQLEWYIMPKVYAESLSFLRITFLPCNYNWSDFICGKGNNAIVFSNLRVLQLDYTSEREHYEFQSNAFRIHFPMIRNLEIKCAAKDCLILSNGVFPKTLNLLNIGGTEGALAHLARLNIAQVNTLKIEQSNLIQDTGAASQFVPLINTITNSIKSRDACKLILHNISDLVNATSLNWPNITYIVLDRVVNASIVLKAIPLLPRLKIMYASLLDIDVTADDVSVPLSNDTQLVVPIHSKINQMDFQLNDVRQLNVAIDFAKYLLLHLPSLTKFNIGDTAKDNLLNKVSAYKAKYPHLENIAF